MAYNPQAYMPNQQAWGYHPQMTQAVNGLVSVTGIDGARAYPLPPNSSMPLFDANDDVMYVKTTDGAGFPTVKAYRFEQVDAEEPKAGYVTRGEFDELARRLDALAERKEAGHAKQPIPEV